MAIFKLHSRKTKTALVLVKNSKFELNSTPAYVPLDAIDEDWEEGTSRTISGEFEFIPMANPETGEAYTSESGAILMMLKLKVKE